MGKTQTPYQRAVRKLRLCPRELTPEDLRAIHQVDPWLAKAAAAAHQRAPMTDAEYLRARTRQLKGLPE